MLFAYIDESERDSQAYFLGSLVCTLDQAQFISDSLVELMCAFANEFTNVDPNSEFHGSSIMRSAEDPWRNIPIGARFWLYSKVLRIIAESQATALIEGININKLIARNYPRPFSPREIAFNYLLERVDARGRMSNCLVQLRADEHHTSEISASNFKNYQLFGTFGYKSSRLPNLMSPIEFVDSKSDRVLQASDMITYIFNRVHTIKESDPRAVAEKLKLWKIIEPSLNPPRGQNRIWP